MLDTIKRAISLIDRGDRAVWVVVVLLAVLVSGVEALGALLIFFVVRVVTSPDAAFDVPIVGDLRERFPGVDDATLFRYLALVIGGFFLLRAVVMLGQVYVQYRLTYRTAVSISDRLLHGYLRMPYAWHLRRNSAEMMRTAYSAVNEVVNQVLAPMVMLLSQALVIVALAVVLLIAAPLATLLVLVTLGGLVIVILRVVQPRLLALGELNQAMSKRSLQSLQQSLHGVREVKLFGREDYFRAQFERAQAQMGRTQYLRQTLTETPRITVETVVIGLLLVFLVTSGVGSSATDDSLALLGLFAYAALRVMPTVNRMVTYLNQLRFGAAAARIVSDDVAMLDAHAAGQREPTVDQLELTNEIAAQRVSFRYEGAGRNALTEVDLRIRRGESVGLVGSTGGGKTTLVDVLLGLLEPTSGRVCVDGVDIADNLPAWHATLGVVPQAQFLLDDTLRRNIAFGLADEEIDEDALDEAVGLAQLGEFVRSLPEGLETVVGERGVRVSGGQRQRVSIARALYRRPAVLAFDEGTSALDNRTEADLIRALDSLRGERTMIIVAHRLTTVRGCDRIVVLEGGRIVDTGTYEELTARSPSFRAIAT
ncbi:MAG: ABC transporter ATP-binding protein [Acidimicrobiia bacterium]